MAIEGLISLESDASKTFQLVSLIIFVCAIMHTLGANIFTSWSERVAATHAERIKGIEGANPVSFKAEILHFFGEVEVIFGLWVVPLFWMIVFFYGWNNALHYLDSRDYVEALFVVVVMSLASSRPIIEFTEKCLRFLSRLMGGSCTAWWFVILTIGPILGSFITEAAAMTLCAFLLARRFYAYAPSKKFSYATIGLLFVNISVGGLLTNFAAPPVLVVKRTWEWSSWFMFTNFGWKAIIGITITTFIYYFFFRKELGQMEKIKHLADFQDEEEKKGTPFWVTLVHIIFLFWVVFNSHFPAIFIGAYLLFLGFHRATVPHQAPVYLKRPLFVGLFLAGLLIHGGLQGWWITPLLGNLTFTPMMTLSMVLTAFNDNAAIAYLASLIPDISDQLKYAVMSGAVVGGGLTVIANAPNPAGLVILKKFFKGKVSPLFLLFGSLIPTAIFYLLFYFIR